MYDFHVFEGNFLKEIYETESRHAVFLLRHIKSRSENCLRMRTKACNAVWDFPTNVYMEFYPIKGPENHAAIVCHQKGVCVLCDN